MANKYETFEVTCDAPPYCVVKVCNLIGIQAPEDVRWRRMSHHVSEAGGDSSGLEQTLLFGSRSLRRRADESHCTCGHGLPTLDMYTFTFSTGEESSFLLGQCRRCRTVFWEDA